MLTHGKWGEDLRKHVDRLTESTLTYLCFGDAMLSQFDNSEISASNSSFDVVETHSDMICFVAGRASSVASIATTTATYLFHLHHLNTSFIEVRVDQVSNMTRHAY